MSKGKSDIYSILADELKKIGEARHPLAKIVRWLWRQRGINRISWDRLVNEYINNDPAIVAKKHGGADKSQERSRINKHLADPDTVTFRTIQQFAKIVKADKMITSVTLQWVDPDSGEVLDEVKAETTELITTK